MGNNILYAYEPDYAVHPGEYIEEILDAKEIKKNELSKRMGISEKHLSQIINKQALINSDIALKLERILGISANIWNNLNADYSLFIAKVKDAEKLNREISWIDNFPVKDLQKLGLLPAVKDKRILLGSLLRFFRIPDPDKFYAYYQRVIAANFRKSGAFDDNIYHILSWMRAGEIFAEDIETAPYRKNVFRENLAKIRGLTVEQPEVFESEMVRLCADAGVALVFVPEFKKTHISGVTHWLTSEKALIIMSLRYKTNDHFWFTFFHEAAHILLHGKKLTFIDLLKESDPCAQEDEANRFARHILLPEKEYSEFKQRGMFYAPDINDFAEKAGIHPGIVVGCLQHEKEIHYSFHNRLKDRFEFRKPDTMER